MTKKEAIKFHKNIKDSAEEVKKKIFKKEISHFYIGLNMVIAVVF